MSEPNRVAAAAASAAAAAAAAAGPVGAHVM